jgi:uncharacterized protein (TIGR02996 family)
VSAAFCSELLALLESVKDQPDDGDRRLAVADWLEERGPEDADRARGRFIRLQCRRARLLAASVDAHCPAPEDVRQGGLNVDGFPAAGGPSALTAQAEYQELEAQEEELRRAYLSAWLGAWRPWIVRPDNEKYWFDRGMLRPWLKGVQWLKQVAQDPGAWLWVDGFVLLDLDVRDLEELAASPGLERLNYLGFGPDSPNKPFGPGCVRVLAASPYLTRLTSLTFSDCGVGPDGARALAESSRMGRLQYLDFSQFDWSAGNDIGDEGVQALAGSAHLASLRHIDVTENGVTAKGARAIAESPYLGCLTSLNLSGNPIGPEGARALAASPFLSRLTRLWVDLTTSPILSAGAWADWRRFADPGHLENLQNELEEAREALRRRFGAAWRGRGG